MKFYLGLILTLLISKESAATPACIDAFGFEPLKSWSDLPKVRDAELSSVIKNSLQRSPIALALRRKYGTGAELTVRVFRADIEGSGWIIQEDFVLKILRAILPDIHVINHFNRSRDVLLLDIQDSTLKMRLRPTSIDMVDLKILNTGPELPGRPTLRASLDLPNTRRIASVYYSYTHERSVGQTAARLIQDDVADIVLLSMQAGGSSQPSLLRAFARARIPYLTNSQWLGLPKAERPTKSVIFNETRGRLPYVHAAADFVVVIGMANIFEPIHAGRFVYFTGRPSRYHQADGWNRFAEAATATGSAQTFLSNWQLIQLIKQRMANSAISTTSSDLDERLALILKPLQTSIDKQTEKFRR